MGKQPSNVMIPARYDACSSGWEGRELWEATEGTAKLGRREGFLEEVMT